MKFIRTFFEGKISWGQTSTHDHLNHHDWGVDPANVGVISQMSLDRTGMELIVIPAEIIVLIMIIFEILLRQNYQNDNEK